MTNFEQRQSFLRVLFATWFATERAANSDYSRGGFNPDVGSARDILRIVIWLSLFVVWEHRRVRL